MKNQYRSFSIPRRSSPSKHYSNLSPKLLFLTSFSGSNLTSTTRKGLTDLLNAVAPPISSHEVLQVTLSHDLKGYDGISDVVFRVLTSVMESHHSNLRNGDDGGGIDQQLVVNKAPNRKDGGGKGGERPKDDGDDERDLNAVEGFEAAKKLAEVNFLELVSIRIF